MNKRKKHWWKSLSDEKLLDIRFCDLDLTLSGTLLEKRTKKLYAELKTRGFVFRPHFWLSTEWFAPEDAPGIALPFYLAHPRLATLERRQVFEVEGGTDTWCMKLLRHETGHAIDTAYQLYRRKQYRQHFGKASKPYPESYIPKPFSRNYVLHLGLWYAQAHPVEDFAETFAVWFGNSEKQWRKRYKSWKALRKLEYVNELMEEIKELKPKVQSKLQIEPLSTIRTTLRTHYKRKCEKCGIEDRAFYDRELRRLFQTDSKEKGIAASSFLRSNRQELRTIASHWTSQDPYVTDQILQQMIERSRELRLRAVGSKTKLFQNTLVMLAVQVTNRILATGKRIAL